MFLSRGARKLQSICLAAMKSREILPNGDFVIASTENEKSLFVITSVFVSWVFSTWQKKLQFSILTITIASEKARLKFFRFSKRPPADLEAGATGMAF
jgi:hypothetical protein